MIAKAFRDSLDHITAVVCTSDSGSSTGVCRKLFDMPAPGDIRAALSTFAALSGQKGWAEVWEERFRCAGSDTLDGMALGNLIIAALTEQTGDFAEAIRKAGELLGLQGRVFPVTGEAANLKAVRSDGSVSVGEYEVRRSDLPAIQTLDWDGKRPEAALGVCEALREADLILIGPGSLYTSVLSCLAVEGVAESIRKRKGRCVYICNTTTTVGQTADFTVSKHVEIIFHALGGKNGVPDAVLVNNEPVDTSVETAYGKLGVRPILPTEEDIEKIRSMGIQAISAPLLEKPKSNPRTLHKIDTIRHDPVRVREALDEYL